MSTAAALRRREPSLPPVIAWGSALVLSILAHGMLLVVLEVATQADPVPFTETIEQRMEMASLDVPSDRAEAQKVEGEAAAEAAAGGERVGVQDVPTSRARPVEAVGETLAAARPVGPVIESPPPQGESLAAARPSGAATPAATLPSLAAVVAAPSGQRLSADSLTSESLAQTVPTAAPVEAIQPAAAPLVAATTATTIVAPAVPRAATVVAVADQGQVAQSAALPTATVAAAAPPSQVLAGQAVESAVIAAAREPGQAVASSAVAGEAVSSSVATGQAVSSSVATGQALATSTPEGQAVAPAAATEVAAAVPPADPETTALSMAAALAWSGDANSVLDEKSLATIQSFMRQGALAESESFAGSARDQIGATLAQFPCSRMQAAFQPENGGLEVRGHVPAEGLRAEVVGLLTETVGGAIPIGGSLLVLPAPQCAVLGAVETLGFPQSNDQAGDPLVIGREAQAAILEMEDGQLVTFDLQAPEFDAFVYIDYFDKDGNVVHVLPNEFDAENHWLADQPFKVGGGAEAGAKFQMRIAPPFGQDIAVVLGSSGPLYDGIRPLVEPAAPYLAWLKERIAALQDGDQPFRGEWAYLFVKTGPAGAFAGE